jgi:AcrR family transcriptional regulator
VAVSTSVPPTTDKRARLIDAAQRVIARRGLAGATTKEIAAEAAVSEGTIYNYFADKVELCLAVVGSRMEDMFRHLPPAGGKRTVRSVLIDVVEERLRVTDEMAPLISGVVADPALAGQFRGRKADPKTRAPFDALAAYIEAEQDAGRIGSDVAPLLLVRMLVGTAFHHSFMKHAVGEDQLDIGGRKFTEDLVDAVLRAAGKRKT